MGKVRAASEMTEAAACLSWRLKESAKIHINYDQLII
jgi:hypothetical protein